MYRSKDSQSNIVGALITEISNPYARMKYASDFAILYVLSILVREGWLDSKFRARGVRNCVEGAVLENL